MSGQASGSNVPVTPKAIASLAKRQAEVTRQGTQKLKFVPTLPARRKKDAEVKAENTVRSVPTESDRGRGHGRGRGGESRGRGTGATQRPAVAMTASGPFAMGPATTGTSARRNTPRSNFSPIVPIGPGSSSNIGAGLSHSAAPSLKKETGLEPAVSPSERKDDDIEAYSDPDEGVEIVDMENIRQMDWMAPESLRKEKHPTGRQKIHRKDVSPAKSADLNGKGEGDIDLSNALNLSDSDSEEELEDLIEDFSFQANSQEDSGVRQERLYFFQFPSPFPTFSPPASLFPDETAMEVDGAKPESSPSRVSFAPDATAAGHLDALSAPPEAVPKGDEKNAVDPRLDGVIGQLEIYQSGAIKMSLGNGILLDIMAATQSSFLQHAVHVDMPNKSLNVLGEVNKRFVVSPDADALLSAMELADQAATAVKLGNEVEEILLNMDTS